MHSIRLPGRESRIEEPLARDMGQIVDEVVCVLLPVLQDKPFAFFGHRYLKSVLKAISSVTSHWQILFFVSCEMHTFCIGYTASSLLKGVSD